LRAFSKRKKIDCIAQNTFHKTSEKHRKTPQNRKQSQNAFCEITSQNTAKKAKRVNPTRAWCFVVFCGVCSFLCVLWMFFKKHCCAVFCGVLCFVAFCVLRFAVFCVRVFSVFHKTAQNRPKYI